MSVILSDVFVVVSYFMIHSSEKVDIVEPFVIEEHFDEGYVQAVLTEAWNTGQDTIPLGHALVSSFEAVDFPVWLVVDFSASTWSLEDAISGANLATRTGITFLRHENMRMLIVVGATRLVNAAASGMNSQVFGNIPVKIVKSLDEAYAYIAANT